MPFWKLRRFSVVFIIFVILMIAVRGSGGGFNKCPLFVPVFNLIVCLFICLFVVCLKSSLGRGSIGSSYLLAVTTLLVPNAEQEIYL